MNFRRNVPPSHLETSHQTNSDLSSNANTTNVEVSLTPMEVDKPREDGGVRLHTPPPPYSSPVKKAKKGKCPKHLDIHCPEESIHPGLGALKTKTDATKLPSAPKFPSRTSSLGLPNINTDLTTSKIPRKVPSKTTSPTSEYSSPREYIPSPLGTIKEEREETSSITAALIDALFAYDDGNFGFEDNFEDMPTSPETGANDQIHEWLATSSPSYSKPVHEKDNTMIDPALLKEDNEKQSTLKHGPSKLSKEVETSDDDSNDADSEKSTAKGPSSLLPMELEESEDTGAKIIWDGSMWPPENQHETTKLEEICKKVAEDHGFTEVVIMSRVITCIPTKTRHTVRKIYYEPHVRAVFSKPPPKDDFYPTKNVKKSNSGSVVRRYNLRKPSTKASFDHQEVVEETALIHVGPNAESVDKWDPEEKEGWEKLGMWRKDGKEVIQWNCGYDETY